MAKKIIGDILFVVGAIILGSILAATIVLAFYMPKYILDDGKVEISQEETEEITVMSTNVRFYNPLDFFKKSWFYRASLITEDINTVKPDVIGFQEATFLHYDHLSKAMPDYDSVMSYRDDFFLSEGCPIFWRSDKFEKVDSGSFWLSETPEVMSKDWGSEHYRITVYVILKEIDSGKQFVVFNTHLDSKSEEARIKGIDVILDKIAEFGNLPAFLMGDLNAEPGSVTVNKALESFGDSAVIAGDNSDSPTYHAWGDDAKKKRLDYILVSSDKIEVTKYNVHDNLHDDVYSSDHYSIYVKAKIN